MSSLACVFWKRVLRFSDPVTGWCCVEKHLITSVLRPLTMRTGGIEVSPPGPNHYYSINSSGLSSLFNDKHNRSHSCIKTRHFRKINPSLSLVTPMHLSELSKDGTCWVRYVLTPPSLWFFSRRCGRRLWRRRGCVARVLPAPKPCLWIWVAALCFRSVIKFAAYEPSCKNLIKIMYKTLFNVLYAMPGFCTISIICAYQLLIQGLIQ